AKALSQFPNIKHLEIALSLEKENQNNIIDFFNTLSQTNPHLNYHIQVKLTNDTEQFLFLTNYLSQSKDQIISLTIIPADFWIRSQLLDTKDPSFKNFFDNCIKAICENNSILRKTSINGFSESSLFRKNKGSSYHFDDFPIYNTHLFAMDNNDSMSAKEDLGPQNLLRRNRNLHALKVLSTKISSFQNILETLPWLELSNLPIEAIVEIFEHLKYQHSLPKTIPPYRKILDTMEKLQESKPSKEKESSLEGIEYGLKKAKGFLTATTMKAYYRYKSHKEDIQRLERFLALDKVQERVVKAISDWFNEVERPDLPDTLNMYKKLDSLIRTSPSAKEESKYFELRSYSPLINELDGIPTPDNKASEHFCEVLNILHHYQKAISRCMTSLRREPYILFQSKAPLNNSPAWKNLSAQSFDGIEFLEVLKDESFSDFSDKESKLFHAITKELTLYLKQKDKPKIEQCDKHKHLHKNELFNLLRPESINIFKDSNPRLYQILLLQRERLANSVSKCSVKLQLRHFGLFSIQHEKKQIHDAVIISDFQQQIETNCLKEPVKEEGKNQKEFENNDEACFIM
nr:hypothetical protein [Tatlockia sp.]